MRGQAGFWDVGERYARLSEAGDPLEKLNTVVPWEMFRKPLAKALKRSVDAKGRRPPYDLVIMFKILMLRALYSLSDDQAEFQIMDRRTFGRFLGLLDAGYKPPAPEVFIPAFAAGRPCNPNQRCCPRWRRGHLCTNNQNGPVHGGRSPRRHSID